MTVPLVAASLVTASRQTPAAYGSSAAGRVEPDPSSIDAAATAVRAFTADLYRTLAPIGGGRANLACSPYSVMVALAMTRAGARGVTAAEMDAVLHAPEPVPHALDAGLNTLHQVMAAGFDGSGEGDRPRVDLANSLWTQRDLAVRPEFLATLSDYYGTAAYPVDFRQAVEAARREINAWFAARTNDRIPELLAAGTLSAATRLVLGNALYLKAKWQFPFPRARTAAAAFTRDDGQVVSAPTMSGMEERLGYAEGDGWIAVDVPYVGSDLAMAIVIPTRGTLAGLEARLDGAWLGGLLGGFRIDWVRLRLPKWSFRLPVDLSDLLAGMGMPTAFSDRADFSGMVESPPLCVDKVVHETFIAVDEKGTEAAAATAVIIRPPSMPVAKDVHANRPFLFVIHDVPRAAPLFVGRVTDPTAT